MLAKFGRAAEIVRSLGLRGGLSHIGHRAHERWWEHSLGIQSHQIVPLAELGIDNPQFREHCPVSYREFNALMGRVQVRPGVDVFLDYGSGMGRALILAATRPFRRAIGVEIAPDLIRVAEENLRRARRRFRCPDVQLVNADATRYIPPGDVSVFFFFNPFRGDVLSSVIDNIEASLARDPRKIRIIYINHDEFDARAAGRDWLVKRSEHRIVPPSTAAIYESRC